MILIVLGVAGPGVAAGPSGPRGVEPVDTGAARALAWGECVRHWLPTTQRPAGRVALDAAVPHTAPTPPSWATLVGVDAPVEAEGFAVESTRLVTVGDDGRGLASRWSNPPTVPVSDAFYVGAAMLAGIMSLSALRHRRTQRGG